MVVQDSDGRWWRPDGRYWFDGAGWQSNRATLTKVPLTGDAARVIRDLGLLRGAILWAPGSVIGLVFLMAAGSGAGWPFLAVLGAIVVTAGAGGLLLWAYAELDVREGSLTRATGMIVLRDVSENGSSPGSWLVPLSPRSDLVPCDPELPLPNIVADLIGSDTAITKHSSNFFFSPSTSVLAFAGSVDYSHRTSRVFRIRTSDGALVWPSPEPAQELWQPRTLKLDALGRALEIGGALVPIGPEFVVGLRLLEPRSFGWPWWIGVMGVSTGLATLGYVTRQAARRRAISAAAGQVAVATRPRRSRQTGSPSDQRRAPGA